MPSFDNMRPWRFLLCFTLSYMFGITAVYFFVFSARYLQQSRVIFGGIIAGMALALLFSWLYFRGVRHLSWRQRVEAVAVWFGLTLLIDMALLIFVHGRSLADLSFLSVLTYALEISILFLAAYITAHEHPLFSPPDLLMKSDDGQG